MRTYKTITRQLALLLCLLVASTTLLLSAQGAHAMTHPARTHQRLCSTPTLQGDWHNINPNTNAMTHAVITFNCGDEVLCDQYGNCTGGQSSYLVHLYGKCEPQDCDWGSVTATDKGNGWIEATYNFGFKTSYVWLKTSVYYGRNYLRVYVYNIFSPGDGRANYNTDEWFLQ